MLRYAFNRLHTALSFLVDLMVFTYSTDRKVFWFVQGLNIGTLSFQ